MCYNKWSPELIAKRLAKNKVSEAGGALEESEDILAHEYAFAKAYNTIQTSEIKHSKTITYYNT